jgi:hypothetical protein
MIKVLFILTILITGVAAVFAYKNGREFTDVRTRIAAVNAEIAKEKIADAALVADCARLSGEVAKLKGEIDVEQEKLKQNKNRLVLAESDTKRVQEEYAAKETKKNSLETELKDLPVGVKPETIAEDIARMKKEKADVEGAAILKAEEVKKEEAKVADVQKRLATVNQKIEDRRKLFERNSLQAQVIAVNPDWGFVVIDTGKSSGIEQDTKLLVTRNRQTVGKVSVISIDGSRTVASIVPDAIYGGSNIAPGDRVILENLTAGQ